MGAGGQISTYLINTLTSLYLVAVLLRIMMQVARVDFFNPLTQFIVKVTNPPLKLLRKVLPVTGAFDLAAMVLAIAIQALSIFLISFVAGSLPPGIATLLWWAVLCVLGLVVNMYFFILIATIIVSWVAPMSAHPAIALVRQLAEPIMRPVRSILPDMGGLDFSPIVVFIAINVIQIALRNAALASGLPANLVMGL